MSAIRRRITPVIVATLALAFGNCAYALDIPVNSDKDHRVRYASFAEDDVIQLDAVVGVATHIQLEPGESYVFHVFGDSSAYEFTHKLNHLFFKPIQQQADSNLTVITDRRSYNFKIHYHDDRAAKALYKLVIRYPEAQAVVDAQAYQAATVGRELNRAAEAYNWQSYTKSGDLAIAPVHAWDNGVHTWMQFAPGAEIPAIYRVDASGQELLTNVHMADDRTIVLHRTSPRWHVRLGQQVVAIRNHGSVVAPINTGTTSPRVQRVIRGQQDLPTGQALSEQPETATLQPTAAFAIGNDGYTLPPGGAAQVAPSQQSAASISPPSTPEPIASSAAKGASQPYQAVEGDAHLAPTAVWLDDARTYFKFANAGIPAIVAIDEAGDEYPTGLHIEPGNVVVMHEQPPGWRLRHADKTLTLQKDVDRHD